MDSSFCLYNFAYVHVEAETLEPNAALTGPRECLLFSVQYSENSVEKYP